MMVASLQPARLPDWPLRLDAFLRQRQNQPFAWGGNDCLGFVCAAIAAITGTDPTPASLHGVQGARRVMRSGLQVADTPRAWQQALHSVATRIWGQPVPVAFAAVGDVLLLQAGRRHALALCNGSTAIGPGPVGLVVVGADSAVAAWKVG